MKLEDAILSGRFKHNAAQERKCKKTVMTVGNFAIFIRKVCEEELISTDIGLVHLLDTKVEMEKQKKMLQIILDFHCDDAKEYALAVIQGWFKIRRLAWALTGRQWGYTLWLHHWYFWRKVIEVWLAKGKPDFFPMRYGKGWVGSYEYTESYKDYIAHIPVVKRRKAKRAGKNSSAGHLGQPSNTWLHTPNGRAVIEM